MVVAEQSYAWQWHYYEHAYTRIAPADIVIDCGSAEGIFPHRVRRSAAQVICFEPLPEFQVGLMESFRDVPNVRIVPMALGREDGVAYLERCGIESTITDRETDTKVSITTIDTYSKRHGITPTYIKADLEGFEMEMLLGAQNTIRRARPKIAITTYHKPDDAREIGRFLRNLVPDYNIYTKGIDAVSGCPVMLHAW